MAHDFTERKPDTGGGNAPGPQPRIPSKPAALADRLPHTPTPSFFYAEHPMRWQLVDGEWLPLLRQIRVDLGVGGVDKTGNMDHAVLDAQKLGWRVIPWEVIPDGYVRAWPCNGGEYHCSRWETPRSVGGRPSESVVDTEGYYAFLRDLVKKGHVRPPDPYVLEQYHLELQQNREKNLAKESHKPGIKPLYDAEVKRTKDMRKAIDALRKAS